MSGTIATADEMRAALRVARYRRVIVGGEAGRFPVPDRACLTVALTCCPQTQFSNQFPKRNYLVGVGPVSATVVCQHIVHLPGLGRREHPAYVVVRDHRCPLGINEMALDKIRRAAEAVFHGEHASVQKRRRLEDHDASITEREPPHC